MSNQYIGEIRAFGFNFAPRGWMFCNGQLLPIQQYTALFSILGVQYGGNGTTNFALPDFTQFRTPIHSGNSAGLNLTAYSTGDVTGTASVALTTSQLPAHVHQLYGGVQSSPPNTNQITNVPSNRALFGPSSPGQAYAPPNAGQSVNFAPQAIGITGQNEPHENRQPFLSLNICICIEGVYPARN